MSEEKITYLSPSPMQDAIYSLGCCGCGCPEETYKAIHEMLLYFTRSDPRENYKRTRDGLLGLEVDPYVQFMAYILDNEGFLEHGSSIGGAWLTDKGKQLLEYLGSFEKYEYEGENVPQELWWVEKEED